MATPITIVLPNWNGAVFAGLAAVSDARLPPDRLLKVFQSDSMEESASMTACATAAAYRDASSEKQRAILAAAAYACVYYGFTGQLAGYNDRSSGGEYEELPPERLAQGDIDACKKFVTPENITLAVTCLIATKINFWHMNHHVGSGTGSPFISKVIETTLTEAASAEWVSVLHTIGHWASTHVILNLVGIHTAIDIEPFFQVSIANRVQVHITDDFKQRTVGMPAGIARHALCHAFVKKYGASSPLLFLPKADLLQACCEEVEALMAATEDFKRRHILGGELDPIEEEEGGDDSDDGDEGGSGVAASGRKRKGSASTGSGKGKRVKSGRGKTSERPGPKPVDPMRQDPRLFYHMGAGFLTGNRQPKKEFMTAAQIGQIGSVLRYHFPKHTMTRSPHIQIGGRWVYSNCESFDGPFDDLMAKTATAMAKVDDAEAKRIMGISTAKIIARGQFIYIKMAAGMSREDAEAAYVLYETRAERPGEAAAPPDWQEILRALSRPGAV